MWFPAEIKSKILDYCDDRIEQGVKLNKKAVLATIASLKAESIVLDSLSRCDGVLDEINDREYNSWMEAGIDEQDIKDEMYFQLPNYHSLCFLCARHFVPYLWRGPILDYCENGFRRIE